MALGQLTLNEMFKEVEKLMEDTQQKLEEAVQQVGPRASHSHCGQDNKSQSIYTHKLGHRGSDPMVQVSLKLNERHKYLN